MAKQTEDLDVDIRQGYEDIAAAIRDVVTSNYVYEIFNGDEDMEDEPAPRAVMISRKRLDELLEKEYALDEMKRR